MRHEEFMRRALALAEGGRGFVSPNPLVGAVIAKNGKVIGEGFHQRCGGPHAERNALQSCTGDPRGADLYVTLEPCCHHGRTPPCTDAILEGGIGRVFVGALDPNPLVGGKGIALLRERGVTVETGILAEECQRQNQVFFHFITTGTPFVVMKYAMTADGKIATKSGRSQWITGQAAREQVQWTRHALTGIMVGIGTVLRDDPLLTCRVSPETSPVRVICDSGLRLPLDCRIARTAREVRTIVATLSQDRERRRALEELGIQLLTTRARDGRVDLADLMEQLGKQNIDSILLEGGGALNGAALEQGIVQKLQVYLGAKVFGGEGSLSPIGGAGVARVEDAAGLRLLEMRRYGDDVLLEYRLEASPCLQES